MRTSIALAGRHQWVDLVEGRDYNETIWEPPPVTNAFIPVVSEHEYKHPLHTAKLCCQQRLCCKVPHHTGGLPPLLFIALFVLVLLLLAGICVGWRSQAAVASSVRQCHAAIR